MTVRPAATNRSLKKAPLAKRRPLLLESLETRQLLTAIAVSSFQAFPNDGADDSYAIQRAIDSAAPGDTIVFQPGTYNVSRTVDPRGGGRIFQGNGATLQSGGNNYIFHFQGHGLTVTGFTFQGPGIFMDNNSGNRVGNLVIDNNTFDNETGGVESNGIYFTTGLENTQITNNVFNPIHGNNGIYGYYWNNLTIANNAFLDGNEGIHVVDHSRSSNNLLIEQNYFSGLHRMGIEYQGGGTNTLVQDNYYENPVLMGNVNQNLDTFAYSIVADKSSNTVVRRNYAKGTDRPDGWGVRVMFELGGSNLDMYDNYSEGGFNVIAVNGTGATGQAHDNKLMDYLAGPFNANGAKVRFFNNGPDTQLTWDINRPKPGPNGHFVVPGGNPTPVPPVGANLAPPTELKATKIGETAVRLEWKDNADNEVGYRVERSFDGNGWVQIAYVARDATQYVNNGLPPGRRAFYRVKAYNEQGFSAYSNIAGSDGTTMSSPSNSSVVNPSTPTTPTVPTAPSLPTDPTGDPNDPTPTLPGITTNPIGTTAPRTPIRIAGR